MLRASPPNAAPRDTTTEPTSTTPLHEALERRARRFLTEGRRGGEALEDLAEEDLAAPLLLRRENSLGVAMASVSTPRSGRPPTPGTTPGTPGNPGAADGPSAPRFPSQQVDSPLSLGARGAWTSGPNAIIWSRDDADVDEEPRNVSDRGANAASRDRTAGVPARPPSPAKLYSLKRAWLMMNAAGETAVLEATKMEMQRELGVPFRDLMILDPALPTAYPSSIFIRPRAIVVNMEHVKLVVTSGLVVSPLPTLDERRGDGDDAKFARRFTRRLKRQLAAGPARACEEDLEDLTLVPMHVPPRDFSTRDDGRKGLDALDEDRETLPADDEASRTTAKMRSSEKPRASDKEKPRFANDTTDLLGLRQTPCELRVLLLPFELRVVEAALHDVSGRLLDEAVALERDAAPALETLAERVSAASLEKTRGIKAAMNSLAARVGAAREALEKLLQDDADMAAMRLSRGDDEALHEDASDDDASKAADDETGKDVVPGTDGNEPNEQREVSARSFSGPEEREETSTGLRSPADVTEKMTRKDDSLDSLAKASASASSASRSGVSVSSAGAGAEAHEGVEALLEAYYMHCDYSFKRLNELRQAVEDTEDLAEIKLDSQRNQLIKVDLMLSNGALAVGAFSMVVGVFGMNLPTGLEASRDAFVEVLFVSAVACVALFVAVVVACRRWKLLQM